MSKKTVAIVLVSFFPVMAATNSPMANPPAIEPVSGWSRQIELANSLVEAGDLDKAEAIYRQMAKDAGSAGDDLRAAVAQQNLGWLLDRKGLALEAEKAYRRAIALLSDSGMRDARLLARTYAGLAALYLQARQYSKAETLIRPVLAGQVAAAEPDKASLMGDMGVILAHKHRFEEAEQMFSQTKELCASADDAEMRIVGAIATANLAGLQRRGGRLAEAAASYRQALTVMESLASISPETLTVTLSNYAGVLQMSGDPRAAEAQYQKAISVAQAQLGPNHPVLGSLFKDYSEILQSSGRKAEARSLARAALRIRSTAARENLSGHTVDFEDLTVRK